jgi:hypothetical protein
MNIHDVSRESTWTQREDSLRRNRCKIGTFLSDYAADCALQLLYILVVSFAFVVFMLLIQRRWSAPLSAAQENAGMNIKGYMCDMPFAPLACY